MIRSLLLLFFYYAINEGVHFNGGTIRWQPNDSYTNATTVTVNITQSYSWTASTIDCANDVPISTFNRSNQNANLTWLIVPLMETDCQTVSPMLNSMISQRSVNVNLTADAHFYLANVGAAWRPLYDPPRSGLQWSMVTMIDLRRRADGLINTPPVASVVSPQYVIVNRTSRITIPVFDANVGDDVRCRWSNYTSGFRRRKRFDSPQVSTNAKLSGNNETMLIRNKRKSCDQHCSASCDYGCFCSCLSCTGNTCNGLKCQTSGGCQPATTTAETPGTIRSTSTFPTRQAIDECGDICYPVSVPTGTTLSNCSLIDRSRPRHLVCCCTSGIVITTFSISFTHFSFVGRRFHQYYKSGANEFCSSAISRLCDGSTNMSISTHYSSSCSLFRCTSWCANEFQSICTDIM